MLVFDASSIVHAWDNYPFEIFPPLWAWLGTEVNSGQVQMSMVAAEEVGHVSPDCSAWLGGSGLHVLPISNAVTQEANRIKQLLAITGDSYHPHGVDENDLFIIATARTCGCSLVSNEASQLLLPQNPARYRIPAVCNLVTVGVPCDPFLEYLRKSGKKFA